MNHDYRVSRPPLLSRFDNTRHVITYSPEANTGENPLLYFFLMTSLQSLKEFISLLSFRCHLWVARGVTPSLTPVFWQGGSEDRSTVERDKAQWGSVACSVKRLLGRKIGLMLQSVLQTVCVCTAVEWRIDASAAVRTSIQRTFGSQAVWWTAWQARWKIPYFSQKLGDSIVGETSQILPKPHNPQILQVDQV